MADRPLVPAALRTRITLLATAITGVVLLLASLLLVTATQRLLTRSNDDIARARVGVLAAAVTEGRDPAALDVSVEDGFVQIVADGGEGLAASPNLPQAPAVVEAPPTGTAPEVLTTVGPDDAETEHYRVWVQRASGRGVTAYVGTSLESVEEATRTVRGALIVGLPVLLLLLAITTWVLTGRTLRPVEAIRTEVEAISDAELDRRVTVPAGADEVVRLARTMNDMLGRLESASRRQREFVADASHELQSPLTSLRVQLEVAAATPGTDWPALVRDLLADTDQMERLVRDLLFLARLDEGAAVADDLVDLDDLVLEETARVRPGAEVGIGTTNVSAGPVRGRGDDLRRMVRNLIENATQHAAARVRMSLSAEAGQVTLVVEDDGPGVADTDRDHVFERFYTGDPARRRGAGTGLGLAIARAVAERCGGTLTLAPTAGEARLGGARFVVRLPSA